MDPDELRELFRDHAQRALDEGAVPASEESLRALRNAGVPANELMYHALDQMHDVVKALMEVIPADELDDNFCSQFFAMHVALDNTLVAGKRALVKNGLSELVKDGLPEGVADLIKRMGGEIQGEPKFFAFPVDGGLPELPDDMPEELKDFLRSMFDEGAGDAEA